MTNFGVSRLRLVNPYSLAFRDARSAVGAAEVLKNATEFDSVAAAVSDCALVVGTTAVRNRLLQQPVHRLDETAAPLIHAQLASQPVALLFGSEKIGLTNQDFSYCHWLLTIPTRELQISMNLGQAVAVCLYELARSGGGLSQEKQEAATAGQNEQIGEGLLEALRISGYVKPGTDIVMERKVRRLLLHLKMETHDAMVLLGMIRQILWKLRQAGDEAQQK